MEGCIYFLACAAKAVVHNIATRRLCSAAAIFFPISPGLRTMEGCIYFLSCAAKAVVHNSATRWLLRHLCERGLRALHLRSWVGCGEVSQTSHRGRELVLNTLYVTLQEKKKTSFKIFYKS